MFIIHTYTNKYKMYIYSISSHTWLTIHCLNTIMNCIYKVTKYKYSIFNAWYYLWNTVRKIPYSTTFSHVIIFLLGKPLNFRKIQWPYEKQILNMHHNGVVEIHVFVETGSVVAKFIQSFVLDPQSAISNEERVLQNFETNASELERFIRYYKC